ncbi:MAG: protein phosphatase 2C domain-containing protein [Cellvibrionaceae bacterium]
MTSAAINAVGSTHVGKVRQHNEDALLLDNQQGLYLVADGMGGHAAGEIASELAIATVHQQVKNGLTLTQAIQKAHHNILQQGQHNSQQQGMGTTIVALQTHRLCIELAWVGDSRIYRFNNNSLEQLSVDHSFVQDMVLRDVLTEEQARNHPDASLLRQALGKPDLENVKVDSLKLPLDHNGCLLLCSDGVSDLLSRETLENIFKQANTLETLHADLQAAVLNTVADDNFTLILLAYTPPMWQRGLAKLLV